MKIIQSNGLAWLLVLAVGLNNCVAGLLLKKSRLAALDGAMTSLLLSPWFLGGCMVYGVNVVLFTLAIDKLPVSVAYPAQAAFGFALLALTAAWFFAERLGPSQWCGLAAVLLGIFLLARP